MYFVRMTEKIADGDLAVYIPTKGNRPEIDYLRDVLDFRDSVFSISSEFFDESDVDEWCETGRIHQKGSVKLEGSLILPALVTPEIMKDGGIIGLMIETS